MRIIIALDNALNFIGACVRWLYGYFFQLTLGHKNFSFEEFLNGSEKKEDIVGQVGHRNVNRFFALLIIVPIVMIIWKKIIAKALL